jgi:phage recombination protein Bet
LSQEDREWIAQTISSAVKKSEEQTAKAIEEVTADVALANPLMPLRFTDMQKRDIAKMIEQDARYAATTDGDNPGQKKFNQYKYEEALPTDAELTAFVYVCEHHRLNPLLKQIYFLKRGGKPVHVIAIDAARLKAERSGTYVPSKSTVFFDAEGKPSHIRLPDHCITYCKRLINGEWHEVEQIAYFDEFKQVFYGKLSNMWNQFPHAQLEKCCEMRMLRKTWPQEFGGLYTAEELDQMANKDPNSPYAPLDGTNTAADALKKAREGQPNQGHGKGDTQKRPAANPKSNEKQDSKPQAVKPKEESKPKEEPKKESAKEESRAELPVGMVRAIDEKNFLCTGHVVEMKHCHPNGEPLMTNKKTVYMMIKIHGLEEKDMKQDPNAFFYCYHRNTLFDCLQSSLGQNISFVYKKSVSDTAGKNYRTVWQNIEDVRRIGDVDYKAGQPIMVDLDAAATKQMETELEFLCSQHGLDAKAFYQGEPRYFIGDNAEVIDRETGDVYEPKQDADPIGSGVTFP